MSDNHTFINEPTKRFHDYVYPLSKKSGQDRDRVFKAFNLTDRSNPYSFFSQLRSGKRGVTLEQILIARDAFGLNPGYLFATSDQEVLGFASSIVEEDAEEYGIKEDSVRLMIGGKVDNILKKHKVKIEPFAKQRLKISKQAMYDKLKGKTRMFFDEVLLICEDTGESMDQFRISPLPKGHHLQQMGMMNDMIDMLKAENASLKKQLKKK